MPSISSQRTARYILISWLCCLAALLSTTAPGALAADAPPDPTTLSVSWWDFFTTSETVDAQQVDERIGATVEKLAALQQQYVSGEQTQQAALAAAVIADLERYRRLDDTLTPTRPVLRAAQDSYTLEDIRDLVQELRKTTAKQDEEIEEVELLEQAVDRGEKSLNRQKVAYRNLSEGALGRAEAGLQMMRARLGLEISARELDWRRGNIRARQEELSHLNSLITGAARRLDATEESIDAAATARVEATRKAEELRLELLQSRLEPRDAVALTDADQAAQRLAELKLLNLEIEASLQEVMAEQSALEEKVLRRVASGTDGDLKADREYLGGYIDTLEAVRNKMPEWRRVTARSRETAIDRIPDESDPEVVAFLEQRTEYANTTDRTLRALEEQLVGAAQYGDILDSLLSRRESNVTRGIQLAGNLAELSVDRVLELANTSLFEIGGAPVTAYDLLRMLLILTLAWWASKLITRSLTRIASKRQTVNTGSVYTLTRILHYVILTVGIMIALSSIGIDFTKFALFASALGVGIGFGMQTLASNFVAGLIILFEKSLKIGDFVELESGVTGEVREINMRSTLVTTNDNVDIVVPNSEFVNGRVTNWTMREAYRRVHIPFGVAYGTDKDLVRKAALEAAENVPETLTSHSGRRAQLWFVEFGDSSLNFELVVWLTPDAVKRPGAVQAKYLWEIDNKLREYDIEVPFPQRDLHIRSVLGKKEVEALYPGRTGDTASD